MSQTEALADAQASAQSCEHVNASPEQLAVQRQALIPAPLAATLAETFRALGDPTRVRILDALSRAELCVCDLAALVGLSESATSHQLRLLRSLRLVRTRRSGRLIFTRWTTITSPGCSPGTRARGRGHACGAPRGPRRSHPMSRQATITCTVCEVHAESTFRIDGMDCHEEVAILERRLKNLAGLESLSADVMGQRLS